MATTVKRAPAKKTSKTTNPSKPAGNTENKAGGAFEGNFDSSIRDLFISELKDMYWSEKHLVAAIPKMIDAAKGADLKRALKNHLQETINQAARLETVFKSVGIPLLAKKCDAMEGLTMGGEHVIESTTAGSPARESGIIGSGLKVEQFEITCYKGLIQMATRLNFKDAIPVFQQNLQEEIAASEKLNGLNNDSTEK